MPHVLTDNLTLFSLLSIEIYSFADSNENCGNSRAALLSPLFLRKIDLFVASLRISICASLDNVQVPD